MKLREKPTVWKVVEAVAAAHMAVRKNRGRHARVGAAEHCKQTASA